jgi:hypothetical protein
VSTIPFTEGFFGVLLHTWLRHYATSREVGGYAAPEPHRAAPQLLELTDIKIDIKILVEIFFVKTIFQQPRRQEVPRRHKFAVKCGPGLLFIGLSWPSVQVEFEMPGVQYWYDSVPNLLTAKWELVIMLVPSLRCTSNYHIFRCTT